MQVTPIALLRYDVSIHIYTRLYSTTQLRLNIVPNADFNIFLLQQINRINK